VEGAPAGEARRERAPGSGGEGERALPTLEGGEKALRKLAAGVWCFVSGTARYWCDEVEPLSLVVGLPGADEPPPPPTLPGPAAGRDGRGAAPNEPMRRREKASRARRDGLRVTPEAPGPEVAGALAGEAMPSDDCWAALAGVDDDAPMGIALPRGSCGRDRGELGFVHVRDEGEGQVTGRSGGFVDERGR